MSSVLDRGLFNQGLTAWVRTETAVPEDSILNGPPFRISQQPLPVAGVEGKTLCMEFFENISLVRALGRRPELHWPIRITLWGRKTRGAKRVALQLSHLLL